MFCQDSLILKNLSPVQCFACGVISAAGGHSWKAAVQLTEIYSNFVQAGLIDPRGEFELLELAVKLLQNGTQIGLLTDYVKSAINLDIDSFEDAIYSLHYGMFKQQHTKTKRPRYEEEPVECKICLEHIKEESVGKLQCHSFHASCIKRTLEEAIRSRRMDLKCPLPECGREVGQTKVAELVDHPTYLAFNQYTLQRFVTEHKDQVSRCPTPDCKYIFSLEAGNCYFSCPLCFKAYCMDCNTDWHRGVKCKQYQKAHDPKHQQKLFKKCVKNAKFKCCAKCKVWVQRNQGCRHMTCRCGHQFCYLCGQNWPCKCPP